MKAPIPKRLGRNAIKQHFRKVREATWEHLFDNEKRNGLYELRVPGPDKFTYYDVEGLMVWLIERGRYRRSDFSDPGELLYEGESRVSRVHFVN